MKTKAERKARKPKAPEIAVDDTVIRPVPTMMERRSEIVAERQKWLAARRRITADRLVPAFVHAIYAQIWRKEEDERKAVERTRAEYSWRGIWRRFVDRVVGKPKQQTSYRGSSGYNFEQPFLDNRREDGGI
jgi:hypothetical protein